MLTLNTFFLVLYDENRNCSRRVFGKIQPQMIVIVYVFIDSTILNEFFFFS